jgi:hypothetical protein
VQDGGRPLKNEVKAEKTAEVDGPEQNRSGRKATLKQVRNEMTLVYFLAQHGINRNFLS